MGRRLAERKEEKRTDDDYIHPMRLFAYIYLICGIFFTIIAVLFNLFPGKVEGMTRVWVNVGWFGFCALLYSIGIEFYLYQIDTRGHDVIVYKPFFRRKVTLAYADVKGYERKPNGTLQVHMNNGKTISFDRDYAFIVRINLKCYADTAKDMENHDTFVVRQARYMRVLNIVGIIVFAGFDVLAVSVGHFFGAFFFFSMLLLGIYICAYSYSEKYFVGDERIEVHRLFHKKKIIPYSDISRVEVKDGAGWMEKIFSTFVGDSKKPVIKINSYYENAFLWRKLAYHKGWME